MLNLIRQMFEVKNIQKKPNRGQKMYLWHILTIYMELQDRQAVYNILRVSAYDR